MYTLLIRMGKFLSAFAPQTFQTLYLLSYPCQAYVANAYVSEIYTEMNVYSCKMSFFRTFQASDKMNHSRRELINKEEKDLSIYSWLGGVILVILKASQENIKTDIKTKSIKCRNVYSPNAPPGNCFRLGISRFIFNFRNAGGWLGTSLCKTFVSCWE